MSATPSASALGKRKAGEMEQTEEGIIWRAAHVDPNNDVVIRSKDGVYLRASSFVLKRESSLFNSMLATLPNPHMIAADAIALDYSSSTIATFLDAATSVQHSLDFSRWKPVPLRRLLELVTYLDCDRLISDISALYRRHCERDPMGWLSSASEYNDHAGACAALGRLRTFYTQNFLKQGLNALVDILGCARPEWHLALVKCLLSDVDRDTDQSKSASASGLPIMTMSRASGGGTGKPLLELCWPSAAKLDRFEADIKRISS